MSETIKAKSLFDHLSGITDKKVSWESLSEVDRKSFSPYMVNRFLSMNMDYIELINEFQKYTIGELSNRDVYKLYLDLLPKQKQFNKYIKGKKTDTYQTELVELLSKHFLISEKETLEALDMYHETSLLPLKEILKKYGKSDKEITKLLKIEK
jgi:hypothetical protein